MPWVEPRREALVNGSLVAGVNNGDSGTVNIDSGAVTVFGDYTKSAQFGSGSSAVTGILNISGGSLTLNNRLALGVGTGSSTGVNVGTVTLNGGTLTTDVGHDEDWHAGVNMASGYDTASGGLRRLPSQRRHLVHPAGLQ